jgi:hypothetical protein
MIDHTTTAMIVTVLLSIYPVGVLVGSLLFRRRHVGAFEKAQSRRERPLAVGRFGRTDKVA